MRERASAVRARLGTAAETGLTVEGLLADS